MRSRVVVVDDSLTVRMDLGEALEAAGFATSLCGDLASARVAVAGGCHLVILDLVLPDGNGLDLLAELKHSPATASLPVLLLSTEAEVASRVRGVGAGADEYLGKPYDLRQVVARARALTAAHGARAASGRRRILVIDDSPTFRELLAETLAAAGHDVDVAASGEEGLVQAAALRPDAILVDGVLPGIDGREVVRRLKADAGLRATPCLLLTGTEEALDELRSLEAGADAYVRKSEELGVVVARLTALLRGAGAREAEHGVSLLAPKRLLAVDDSPTYLDALGVELREEGYDVVLATSGEEALELLASQPVDCILLDLLMPGLSGQETCQRIKHNAAWRDIPLVILTSRDDRGAMIEGINAGADDYISKSADFEVLKARLRAQLRRKHFEDENRRIRDGQVRRETEARFQRLVHSNIIGVFLGDTTGRISEANDAFLAMLGYGRTDLEAGTLHDDRLTPPEWRERDARAMAQLRQVGSVAPYEKELYRRDGSLLPIVLGQVLLEGSDATAGFVLDRTEKKEAEERIRSYTVALETANRELALAKETADRANGFKSSFLASMSHELRTPLNAIIGFAELLHDGVVPEGSPQQHEFIGDILTSGRHLLLLINDVLDLSKVEAGRLEFHPRPLQLAVVVNEVLAILRTTATDHQIEISAEFDPAIVEVIVDPDRLKQVLYNYLSNALKFTPERGRVIVRSRPEGPSCFRLEVEDSGIGISPSDLALLFKDFQQLDSGAAKRAGTGLGLALTRRLVEAQGGSVGASSHPGAGSTFFAVLPRIADSARRPPTPEG